MKRTLLWVTALWVSAASASVTEVHQWQATPGKTEAMLASAVEARTIHEKLGATVFIGVDQNGIMHYAATFPDWAAWGVWTDKIGASKEWADFNKKYDTDPPAATHLTSFLLDTPIEAKTQPVLVVASWKVAPGKLESVLAAFREFVAVDTKLGGSVGFDTDEFGNAHYELTFPSYAAYGKWIVAADKSPERAALIKKWDADPKAELTKFYVITQYAAK